MSKFLTFTDVTFKDRELLVAALAAIGYTKVEEGENLSLYGYRGDRRKETAEIVVRRQHVGPASNDIGFKRTDAGYVPIISEYDRSYTQQGRLLVNLRIAYGERVATRVALRLRGTTQQKTEGRTRIIRVRY